MTCIHGLGCSVVDYEISYTHVLNCIVIFELLNDREPNYYHKHVSLTLNIDMHTNHMQKNCEIQRHIHFDKSKIDLFLKDLKMDLGFLMYNDNIDNIYHKFSMTLSTTIKFLLSRCRIKK